MGPPSPSSLQKEGDPAFRHSCTYRARFRFPTHSLVIVPLTITHAAEVAIIRRPYDSTAWHRSSRWESTYSVRELGFNQFRLNHSRGSCSTDLLRYRHAVVPYVFRFRVSRLTHRSPSESILAARGIQVCVTRRTRQVGLRPTQKAACTLHAV